MKSKSMISVIFLAGGRGLRLGASIPKQYLDLNGKKVFQHSLDKLSNLGEVVVVAEEDYRDYFSGIKTFADPGERRQDSVYNGLQVSKGEWILIHDASRPFPQEDDIHNLIEEAYETGAATLALPLKFTIKEALSDRIVRNTPDRSHFWEIQTPQMVRRDILEAGFKKSLEEGITVTDDVSLAELTGAPVKLVMGSDKNIKITTAEDLACAEWRSHHARL